MRVGQSPGFGLPSVATVQSGFEADTSSFDFTTEAIPHRRVYIIIFLDIITDNKKITFFSRLDGCTDFFPCVRKTRADNAPAFEDPAVLDLCGCRMRLSQGNSLLTSLLLLLF